MKRYYQYPLYILIFFMFFSLSACANPDPQKNSNLKILNLLKKIETKLLNSPVLDVKLLEREISVKFFQNIKNPLEIIVSGKYLEKLNYLSSISYAYFKPSDPSSGGILNFNIVSKLCITPLEASSFFGKATYSEESYDYLGNVETSISYGEKKNGSFYFTHDEDGLFNDKKSCLKNAVYLFKGKVKKILEQSISESDKAITFTPKVEILHISPEPSPK